MHMNNYDLQLNTKWLQQLLIGDLATGTPKGTGLLIPFES